MVRIYKGIFPSIYIFVIFCCHRQKICQSKEWTWGWKKNLGHESPFSGELSFHFCFISKHDYNVMILYTVKYFHFIYWSWLILVENNSCFIIGLWFNLCFMMGVSNEMEYLWSVSSWKNSPMECVTRWALCAPSTMLIPPARMVVPFSSTAQTPT